MTLIVLVMAANLCLLSKLRSLCRICIGVEGLRNATALISMVDVFVVTNRRVLLLPVTLFTFRTGMLGSIRRTRYM